jgi:hypothetical protein
LRDKVWAAYKVGQEENHSLVSREYVAVAKEVQQWIEDNYRKPTNNGVLE